MSTNHEQSSYDDDETIDKVSTSRLRGIGNRVISAVRGEEDPRRAPLTPEETNDRASNSLKRAEDTNGEITRLLERAREQHEDGVGINAAFLNTILGDLGVIQDEVEALLQRARRP